MVGFALLAIAACPDPAAVVRQVDALSATPAGWTVRFTPMESSVRLDASAADQAFSRELPRASCEDLEAAAVVILSSWQADLRPLPPVTRAVMTVAPAPQVDTVPESSPWAVTTHVSLLLTGVQPGVGLGAGAAYAVTGSPISVRLGLEGALPREAPLGDGRLAWSRLTLSPGAEVRVVDQQLRVSFDLRVVGGPLWLESRGLPVVTRLQSWDLGGRLGVRLDWVPLGHLRPSLEASVQLWALRHDVHLEGSPQVLVLPPVEGELSLGVAWGG